MTSQMPVIRPALVEQARTSIERGSKSFTAASKLFDPETRERVWLLYAWCRACDDIADAQDHGHAPGNLTVPQKRVASVRMLTSQAFSGKLTGSSAFDALYILSLETELQQAMADDVIAGFTLDAQDWRPRTEADTLRYCFHVAGAVGVMMASVMGVPRSDEDTLDRACDLGIAFQLANIARDIAEDAAAGRCYLPGEWLDEAGIPADDLLAPEHREALVALVAQLCDRQREYEASARVGAARLPFRQRWAILSAANIYGAIARKVERLGSEAIDRRVHTSKVAKLGHVVRALGQCLWRPKAVDSPEWSRRELAAFANEDQDQPSPLEGRG